MPSSAYRRPQPAGQVVSLDALLNTTVDLSMINADTPLNEALEIMSNSVQPNLPLLVLWGDLENNALIDKEQPVGVSGFGRMKLGQAFKIVLRSVAAPTRGDLVMVAEGQVLTLGTRTGLQYKPVNRVYSITDLALPPSFVNEFGSSRNGQSSDRNSSGRNSSRRNNSGGSYGSGMR